jgi:hypothetical protein
MEEKEKYAQQQTNALLDFVPTMLIKKVNRKQAIKCRAKNDNKNSTNN